MQAQARERDQDRRGKQRTAAMTAAVAVLGAALLAGSGRAAAAPAATWGAAQEVPGTAALNHGDAALTSVSCGSPGNCSAGGSYLDGSGRIQVFVVSQTNGTWGAAIEAPGTAALNQAGVAALTSLSCGSAGNCGAGGSYRDSSHRDQAFVVSQTGGTWQKAIEVPGTAALNQGGEAALTSLSCAAAGNCSAGGFYVDGSGGGQSFVVSEVNGTWHTAIKLPGTAALNGHATLTSLSCASAGNCSAGGAYTDRSGRDQAFVTSQVNGTWQKPIEVPGIAALNQGGRAVITSVSCAAPGSCSAGGSYAHTPGNFQVFVVSQTGGTWHTAIKVPGTGTLNHGDAALTSVSCGSAGNCAAGGSYLDGSGHFQAFVASQTGGTWQKAIEVPGTAALNQGGNAHITSVSCASAGNCGAGGHYSGSSGGQAFVVSQTNGTWGTAIEVPGTAALNQGGGAETASVSCAAAGNCAAGGSYTDNSGHVQVFVDSET